MNHWRLALYERFVWLNLKAYFWTFLSLSFSGMQKLCCEQKLFRSRRLQQRRQSRRITGGWSGSRDQLCSVIGCRSSDVTTSLMTSQSPMESNSRWQDLPRPRSLPRKVRVAWGTFKENKTFVNRNMLGSTHWKQKWTLLWIRWMSEMKPFWKLDYCQVRMRYKKQGFDVRNLLWLCLRFRSLMFSVVIFNICWLWQLAFWF